MTITLLITSLFYVADPPFATQPVGLGTSTALSAGGCSLLQPTCGDSYLLIKALHANTAVLGRAAAKPTQSLIIYDRTLLSPGVLIRRQLLEWAWNPP